MNGKQSRQWFYDVVWPERAGILRLGQLLTGNEADAEDLAQETLLKAFKSAQTFQSGTDVRTWLMTILRNTRIDRLRARASSSSDVSLDALELEPEAPPAESEVQWDNPQELLNEFSDQQIIAALLKLPEEIRLTLLLVDVQQMDQGQASQVLQVPVGTIKSRAHRGRAMLREKLLPLARELRIAPKEGS